MQISLDAGARGNVVRAYSEERIQIGAQTVESSCIVTADVLIGDWEPATFAELSPAHLSRLFELEPEIVLLGTGAAQQFPAKEIRRAFAERNIALEAMDLGAACRTYNVLVSEGRRVAAMLFLS